MKMSLIAKDLWESATRRGVLIEDASQVEAGEFHRRCSLVLATIRLSVAANIQIEMQMRKKSTSLKHLVSCFTIFSQTYSKEPLQNTYEIENT